MSIYGYCRISTAKQSIDRQIRNIKAEYPTAHIVQEAYTGTSIFRPEWLKLYRILKSGRKIDKQVLSDLIDKEELFWTNHVVPQIPPAPNGCDCDTQQINQMYEVDDRDKTADLSALHGLLDKRQELSDQIEQMEQEKTAIEQQVKLQMQDAAYGTAPGYKVSWVSSESKRVDSQRLRKEQPDIFNQYSKNVSSRRFTIVHAA